MDNVDGTRFSIAPMQDYTDTHFRYLMRLLTQRAQLYTEMLVDQTLIYQRDHLEWFLRTSSCENPVVVQLGGSDPESMAEATSLCNQYGGFREINVNCGCPSPKCAKGGAAAKCFGARLMLQPHTVLKVVKSMMRRTQLPVTVKCRIGADSDKYEELVHFIQTVSQSGCKHFIIHARMCMLDGLTPAQNRTVPPLKYEVVHQLMREFPDLTFTLNGGIKTLADANVHLDGSWFQNWLHGQQAEKEQPVPVQAEGAAVSKTERHNNNNDDDTPALKKAKIFDIRHHTAANGNTVPSPVAQVSSAAPASAVSVSVTGAGSTRDGEGVSLGSGCRGVHGVMVGRLAYTQPWVLRHVDSCIFGEKDQGWSRREVVEKYLDYAEEQQATWGVKKAKGTSQVVCPSRVMIKPLLGLFAQEPNGKLFKTKLVNPCYKEPGNVRGIVEDALKVINEESLSAV